MLTPSKIVPKKSCFSTFPVTATLFPLATLIGASDLVYRRSVVIICLSTERVVVDVFKRIAIVLFLLICTWGEDRILMAEPIGLMEKYALASDREAVLAELIPGSEDYFFFHCLHCQNTGELDRAEAILKDWLAHHKGREHARLSAMTDRQRLLTYGQTPERTIDHLIKRLGVKLDHTPPAIPGQRRYESQLNDDLLDLDRLVQEALKRNDSLKPSGLDRIAQLFRAGQDANIAIKLRDFLDRLHRPTLDGLDDLVIRELKSRPAKERRFGDLSAHRLLTEKELVRVGQAIAEIADDSTFVKARIRCLRVSNDQSIKEQPEIRLGYLQRVKAYIRTLPTSYNSLKACVTYRLLEAMMHVGDFDEKLFLEYLQLPRNSPIVHVVWLKPQSYKANLDEDFRDLALVMPVGDEEPLVRKYLEHFLVDAENTDAFAKFLTPDYLRRVFAETKLLSGVGQTEQWYKLLSSERRKEIRDSVQLRLAPQNTIRYKSDQPTELIIDVKNIDELVVRTYEINSLAYYRTHDQAIDTDIDLDGLVPTKQETFRYSTPAIERHREVLNLDHIEGRGVWIVDLVGKGLRARALILRGEIHHVDSVSADGQVFTIVDEERKPIADATMLVAGQELKADDKGRIVLPPVSQAVPRSAVIADGNIATKIRFKHLGESYQLSAGMHIDRTLLQTGGSAKLLIRPRLEMSGQVVDPTIVNEITALFQATDLEGLSTTLQFENLEFDQNSDLVIPFRVPPRLANLSVRLSGKVKRLSDGRQQSVDVSEAWKIAEIRATNHPHDTFLTCDGDDYIIHVRGRSGESVADASVRVWLTTTVRQAPVEVVLQSDKAGHVRLNRLPEVSSIRFQLASGLSHDADLEMNRVQWQTNLHATADQIIQLPMPTGGETNGSILNKYRLLEIRGDQFYADHSEKLKASDGFLCLGPLPAGDFRLLERKRDRTYQITVVDGVEHGAVAVGKVRHRSLPQYRSLAIESIDRGENEIKIKLSGETSNARLHVFGLRYLDSQNAFFGLQLAQPPATGRNISLPRCGYISDLRLGDEYQYVLRRREIAKFPGVMLPQPSVILNPWETEETANATQAVHDGDAPMAAGGAAMDEALLEREEQGGAATGAAFSSDFDFLEDSGALITNLIPDKQGVVTIPLDVVQGLPILQLVVCDHANVLQRVLKSPAAKILPVDLRLAKSLDAEKAMTFDRTVSIVSKDQPLDLQSLGSAKLQVYGSVGSLLKLYKTLVPDPRLNEFDELADWHRLEQQAKLEAYSRLASHELHLFLWAHDREFFDRIIRPYLQNKKEKQFIDHWLLEGDLSEYTTLWRYNELNAAERALLAARVQDQRESVLRELGEIVAREDRNQVEDLRRIEQALSTGGLLYGDFIDADSDGVVDAEDLSIETRGLSEKKLSQLNTLDDGIVAGRKMAKNKRRSRAMQLESDAQKQSDRGRGALGRYAFQSRSAGQEIAFYQELDSTKQWAEAHWDHVRTVGGPEPNSLISTNQFWVDVANRQDEPIQASSSLLQPSENRHSVLVALAMCGLPLKAGNIDLPSQVGQSYAPEHPVAVVTKRLKSLEPAENESGILVGQQFFAVDAPKQNKNQPQPEPKEFLVGVAYRGQIVVSNPTAQQLSVDVFWQIPAGSIPLGQTQSTDNKPITLKPFAVQAIQYAFYFPRAGQYVHYPATVSADGKLLARGPQKQFGVLEKPTQDESVNWQNLARAGTPKQIREFLKTANLRDLDWMLVAHRMQDQDIYQTIIKVLEDAKLPISELWAYSLKHRDNAAIRSFLSLQVNLANRVGPSLRSPLLDIQPIDRRFYEHLEYAPLVRARIHRLGTDDEILNPTFLTQYRQFVRVLGFMREIPKSEKLALTYYLLLQNRIEEALSTFDTLQRDDVETKLQWDYVDGYLAMHREAFDRAEKIANQYVNHPIARWRQRFATMADQLRQRRGLMQAQQLASVDAQQDKNPKEKGIAEGTGDLALMDREKRQAGLSEQLPKIAVTVEGNSLRIDHQRAKQVSLNLYGVDLELLFSKAPFVRDDLQRMAMVRPFRRETIDFEDATGIGRFDLGDDLQRQTMLVEVVAGGSRSTALFYGGKITTYVSEGFGQLQTTDATTHQPISKAYVKVYGRYPDGSVRFYKDGYTDARGRFDYASISAAEARGVNRFAILVLSEEKGATLHDVAPPTQ